MKRFGKPVGCRDRQTETFLASQGIFSYFSGCLTLTLPKREKEPGNGKVFIVDIHPSLLNKIPESIRQEAEFVTHMVPFSKVPIPEIEYWEFENDARKMLHRYKTEARLIITSRIHCAMPCAAMGIPVIFLTKIPDDCRFDVLSGILPIQTERSTIDWDVPAPNLDEVKHFIKHNALTQLRGTAKEYGIALGAPLQYDLLPVKNRIDTGLIRTVHKKGYTYLDAEALYGLADEIRYVDEHHIEGILIETGVAGGGSSIVAAKHKDVSRTLKLYDSYEGMPKPSEGDGADVHRRYEVIASGQSKGLAGNIYYGYEKDLLATVKKRFSEFEIEPDKERIEFIKGYYEQTLAGQVNEPVAFAHIDCDWYESVKTVLENIAPYLSLDGRLIIDDYNAYSGCRKAVDEFFADKKDEFEFAFRNNRLHIVKIGKMGGGGSI
jgi:asparagine synthase (glutamine-hydrolysing)